LKKVNIFLWSGVALAFFHQADAAFVPGDGFSSASRLITAADDYLGGLDVVSNQAYVASGTNVWRVDLGNTNAPASIGTVPAPSTGASFISMRAGDIHLGYSTNFAFPPSYRYGRLVGGAFEQHGLLGGIYDGDVDADGNLYVLAYPDDFLGSRVYRYEPAQNALVEVIFVGGYSGGIAFDRSNRLHVAEQSYGEILRFTPAQLAAGNLVATNGQVVARVSASYLCFDSYDRLYAVTGYGNEIALFDTITTNKVRSIAFDRAKGYGIGWIKWNRDRQSLYAVYTDYYVNNNSQLFEITYASDSNGIPHNAPQIKQWIAAYTNYVQPDPPSGGFAQDDNFAPATPGVAIIGKPAGFTPDDVTSHVLSLGDGSSITLMFPDAIVDRGGADFAVFENGFSVGRNTYAELAFVEVATTTNAWARFPTTYLATNNTSLIDTAMDVRRVDGFAGKHRIDTGTPFDLSWLSAHTNVISGAVDLRQINFIRIVDVPGDGSVTDDLGNPVFDAAGFEEYAGLDLRGIGVIHPAGLSMTAGDGAPVMQMMAMSGRTYQLEYSFGNDVWTPHGSAMTNISGSITIPLPPHLSGAMFRINQAIPFTP